MSDVSAIAIQSQEGDRALREGDPVQQRVAWRRRLRRLPALLGAVWLAAVVFVAIFAPLLPLHNPSEITNFFSLSPFSKWSEPLGTDALGRSVLSRVAFGARVSLSVSVGGAIIAMLVGGTIGVLVGYFRGIAEHLFEVFANSLLAFPPLVLLIIITTALRPSVFSLILALAATSIPSFARISRATTLSLRNREYVTASRALGSRHLRIIGRELIPSVLLALLPYSIVIVSVLIVAEGSLSFLGLGVPPPTPSWGGMIADGRDSLIDSPFLVFVPGGVLFLTVLSLNLVGDWARTRFQRESAL